MSPSRLRVLIPVLRHPLLWLAIASLLITLYLSAVELDAARAFQSDSPLPTNTPVPSVTPIPTTPVPTTAVPTSTPPFTATPVATLTTPLPTATFPVDATATSSGDLQTPSDLRTPTPSPFETPFETPTQAPIATLAPGETPLPPAIVITATPLPAVATTEALTSTLVITETGGAVPATQDADALVDLIDTFVLYSAYFLLGCGVIIFAALAIGFYYLHRRARTLD